MPYSIKKVAKNYLLFLGINQVCSSHGIDHALAVYKHCDKALQLSKSNNHQKELILLASLLHDADDVKFFPNNNDNKNVRSLLVEYDKQDVDKIVRMINYVSCSKNGDTIPEEAIENEEILYPRYSDRLEALGMVGVQRCYKYTKTINNPLFLDSTPRITNEEELWKVANKDRYKNYNGNSVSMVDHYYDKLLRLGNFNLNNDYLKTTARQRIQPLINIVLNFGKTGELNITEWDNDLIFHH